MSTTNILDLNNRVDELEKNSGGGGSADSAKRSDIATEFNTTTAYTAGCYVYHEGKLYQFNADHAAGAWDPTDVVEANVTDQIVSNKSAIAGLTASDVAYDNTDSGLTATDVQGAVDEVNNRISANTFDTLVDIKGTTGYTAPSDGYVRFSNDSSSTSGSTYAQIRVNGEALINRYPQHLGAYETESVFVHKGMIIKDESTLNSYALYFIPLSTT